MLRPSDNRELSNVVFAIEQIIQPDLPNRLRVYITAQGGLRSTLPQPLAFQKVVHNTLDTHAKSGNIHLGDLRTRVFA